MPLAALLVLLITVLVGVLTLAEFTDPKRMATMPGAVALVGTHVVLALGAAALWTVYLITDASGLAWAGFGVVATTAVAGLTLFRHSLRPAPTNDDGTEIEMRQVSRGLLIVHGSVAAVTVVLALVAAIGGGR